jgi:hypothetical protein
MCVVSYIGDYGRQQWPGPWDIPKTIPPAPWPTIPPPTVPPTPWLPLPELPGQTKPVEVKPYNGPTKEQFEEFLELLRQGARFDRLAKQPHCEQDEKIAWIKRLAEYIGVDPKKVDEALKG